MLRGMDHHLNKHYIVINMLSLVKILKDIDFATLHLYPLGKVKPFNWTKLNSLHQRIICMCCFFNNSNCIFFILLYRYSSNGLLLIFGERTWPLIKFESTTPKGIFCYSLPLEKSLFIFFNSIKDKICKDGLILVLWLCISQWKYEQFTPLPIIIVIMMTADNRWISIRTALLNIQATILSKEYSS